MSKQIDTCLAYIFVQRDTALAAWCATAMVASVPFATFVETYRDKIRKKVRLASDEATRGDLLAELTTAAWLLQDRRCALAYEADGVGLQRGPDFRVTFRANQRFHVEVSRLRPPGDSSQPTAVQRLAKISATICTKLGQLPSGVANLLVLVADPPLPTAAEIGLATGELLARAAEADPIVLQRSGSSSARQFQRSMQRLSAVVVHARSAPTGTPSPLWINPQRRHELPPAFMSILRSAKEQT